MFKPSAIARACKRPFSITFVIPGFEDGKVPNRLSCPKTLKDSFDAYVFKHPVTGQTFSSSTIIKNADPSVIYTAFHPASLAFERGVTYNQMSDRAFEQRAIHAVERYLTDHYNVSRRVATNPNRDEGWRYLTGKDGDVEEWEGVWIRDDGHYFFLEAKHAMTVDQLGRVDAKLTRSLAHLNVSRSNATAFLAGNVWLGGTLMTVAENMYKFGVVHSNGVNLDVKEPSMS